VHKDIEALVGPLRYEGGKLQFTKIMELAEVTQADLSAVKGISEGVCPNYSAGYCARAKCNMRHLLGHETPKGYPKWFCSKIEKGVKQLASERGERPYKKRKKEEDHGSDQG